MKLILPSFIKKNASKLLIKRFNRLNFVIGLNETKESWPNSFRNQIEQGIKGKLLKILVKFGLGFHLHKY